MTMENGQNYIPNRFGVLFMLMPLCNIFSYGTGQKWLKGFVCWCSFLTTFVMEPDVCNLLHLLVQNYRCCVVIPDLYQRDHIAHITELLLGTMGFAACFVFQVSDWAASIVTCKTMKLFWVCCLGCIFLNFLSGLRLFCFEFCSCQWYVRFIFVVAC